MPINILDFQITKVSDEYRLGVFRRDNSQPLASAPFDFPRGYPGKFDLGQLDFDVRDPQAPHGPAPCIWRSALSKGFYREDSGQIFILHVLRSERLLRPKVPGKREEGTRGTPNQK